MPSETPLDVHRPGRGGYRGGGKPRILTPDHASYLLKLPGADLRFCMAQTGKAAAFLRRLVRFARALDLPPAELDALLERPDDVRRLVTEQKES